MKINKEVIKHGASICCYAIIGFWVGWCLSNYTMDVYKRNHNTNTEAVWTNFKVVDGVYNKVFTNDLVKSNELVVLGLRKDGLVVWKVK